MSQVDCTDLARAVARLALHIGSDPAVDGIDGVVAEMRKDFPEITRTEVVDSIVAASTGRARVLSDISKQLGQIKTEAKSDASIRKSIEGLREHLDAATVPEPGKRVDRSTEALRELRGLRDALRKEVRGSDPAVRKRLAGQIDTLADRLEKTTDTPPAKPEKTRASRDIERLTYLRDGLRKKINAKIESLKPRTFWQKTGIRAAEPFNFARTVMTSFDFSAVLRQGGFITLGRPVLAAKSLGPMFKAMASPIEAAKTMAEIESRPNAPLYDRAKLYIAPLDGPLASREEAFMSRFAEWIPGVGASQRGYVVFLNKLRADAFDAMAETLTPGGDATIKEAKAIAGYINVATGRGMANANLGDAGAALSNLFFSPRLVASRFQLLAGHPLYGGTARTRKLIAKEYGRFLTGVGVLYVLAWLAGAEIEDDPRSTAFGKIRFGNTSLDPLAGLQQVTVLAYRIGSGEQVDSRGKTHPVRGKVPYGKPDSLGLVGRFARYKFSPLAAWASTVATGKDAIQRPTTPLEATAELAIPLSFRDIYGAIEEHGFAKGGAMSAFSLFGMGLQHRDE